MHTITARGFILRMIPYGETDIVATLLTRELGVVSALAKSARKSKKRFGPAFDLMNLLGLEIKPSGGGLAKLLSIELIKANRKAAENVDAYFALNHILEITRLALKEGEPHPEHYDLLEAALAAIEKDANPAETLRLYQIRLIALMGYSLAGKTCVDCGKELQNGAVYIGSAPHCHPCGGLKGRAISPGTHKTILAALTTPFGKLRIPPKVETELKPLIEQALETALGTRVRSW